MTGKRTEPNLNCKKCNSKGYCREYEVDCITVNFSCEFEKEIK